MPNVTTLELVIALKQTAEDYRVTTIIPVQVAGYLGYRSVLTRALMDDLGNLDTLNRNPQKLIFDAVKAIIAYIHAVGTSESPARGYWVKTLQPCLEKFAQDPPIDLSEENKEEFLILEQAAFPCTPQIIRQRGMLFNALGNRQLLARKFHLDLEEGVTNANWKMNEALLDYEERKLEGNTPGAARILQATFAGTKNIPGKIHPFAKNEEDQNTDTTKYQKHTLLKMLDKIDHDELLIFLKGLNQNHPSIVEVMPSLLYKIADRKQAQDALAPPSLTFLELPHWRYAREAKLDKLTQIGINCLKEIKRLAPNFDFSASHHKLYAIITGNAQHTFASEPISNERIADEIAARPLWKQELTNESSSLYMKELALIINPVANTRTLSTGNK